jgi:PAS domain S-box-containing protein
VAIAAALAAVLARVALDPLWGTTLPYITLFPAIMLSAWLGGLGPGIVTTVITAAAAAYFWVEPARSLAMTDRGEWLGMGVFLAIGVVISALNEAWRRGAEALAESEERLRVTLGSIGDAVIATDDRERITSLNDVAVQLTGWSREDALRRPLGNVFVIIDAHSRQPVASPVTSALRSGTATNLARPTLLVAKDGREIPIDNSAAPIHAQDGRVAGVVMVFRDLSGRRLAEQERAALLEAERAARRQSEAAAQQLQAALQAGRMGTWQFTPATGEVSWSPGLEAIHGYAPGTFPGTFEAFHREIHPADRERVLQAITDAIEQRREHHIEYRIVRGDGTTRWVEGVGDVVRDEDGRPRHMVGVCTDITERKQADERFRLAVEAAPAAMIMVDGSGTIVLANALIEQILGYTRIEIVGRSVEELVPLRFRARHGEHRSSFLADARQRPMGAGRELYAVRKDGSEVRVEIGLSPIETDEGLYVLAAVTDVTARAQVEEERARLLQREQAARGEIERASRMKDEFLAVLSHELRTPLNAVLGYAHLLVSRNLPPERANHALRAIQRNAQSQAHLVESLLDLSRVMAGKLELKLQQLDLAKAVDAAVDVVRPDADARALAIEVLPPASPTMLVADGARLQQVLWNLLSNAVKFTPRGGRITVRWAREGDEALIEVSDDGHGIRPEFLPHVFDRFRQADSHQSGVHAGLGLGLALVREIVHAHRGTIAAESAGEGRGSTFIVRLPISIVPTQLEPAQAGEPDLDVRQSLLPLEVLIVDDDADARDLLALLLESRGAVARTAVSARDALVAIEQHRPDVLLADLQMPGEDGYWLIRTLREREGVRARTHLPAIAVTAHASSGDRERAIAAGYDDHIAKPIKTEELAHAIARIAKVERV